MRTFFRTVIMLGLLSIGTRASAQLPHSLAQCIEQAWAANLNIRQSQLNIRSANYDRQSARTAWHPNFNASYTNGLNWGRSIDPTSYQFVTGMVNTNNISLNAGMTLFDGFATPTRIRQSAVGVEMANSQLEQQKNQVALAIASAYLQMLLAHERRDLVTQQLDLTRELLQMTQVYFKQGLKPESEVLQVRSQLAQEVADSVQAENTLQLARLSLMQLMEAPYDPDFDIERFDPAQMATDEVPGSERIFEAAATALPEIRAAEDNIRFSELERKARLGAYYPSLALNGRLGTNYASSSRRFRQEIMVDEAQIGYLVSDPSQIVMGTEVSIVPVFSDYAYLDQLGDNLSGSVSLSLSFPIYNRKQARLNVARADLNIESAQINLQSQKNQLRKSIESDYLEHRALTNQLASAQVKLAAYQTTYKRILKQYELRLSNSYELMLEKNKIFATEREIAQLQYQRTFKLLILHYYQTGIVEVPNR